MINTILDYEEVMEALEEENKKIKLGVKKIALMHQDTILQLFDIDTDIENIEHKAIEFVKNTLQMNNIDLCYIVIDTKYCKITYKDIIQKDIIEEELENYQRINNHICVLNEKELKAELLDYSENIFLDMLKDKKSNAYFEIINDVTTYNNCVELIFEEVEDTYNSGYTVFTTGDSFLLYGSYSDATTTDFEDEYYILNQDTKLFLIDEIENSDLTKTSKKEIIKNIKNY